MRYHQTKVGNVYVTDPTTGVPHDCHPVAVIPFEDREQVERFREIASRWADDVPYSDMARPGDLDHTTAMQAALREFAAPTPPKPDEPQGLGAVVEDADGQRWVRAGRSHDGRLKDNWRGVDGGDRGGWWSEWKNITAVRVLSEGVVA